MAFPRDWPRRWWLRKGEIAGVLKLPNRRAEPVIFDGDDGRLWGFKVFGKNVVWDHWSGHHAFGLDGSDPELGAAVRDLIPRLADGREAWILTKEEKAILEIFAAAFRTPITNYGMTPVISGRKLRQAARKQHGIEADSVAYWIERLGKRYVETVQLTDGNAYRLTLPGVMATSMSKAANDVIMAVITVLSVKFDEDPDVDSFTLDEIMRASHLPDDVREDRLPVARLVPLLRLSPNEGNGEVQIEKWSWHWYRPTDIEQLIECRTVADFWRKTIDGSEPERCWPTAPMRLVETVNELERMGRVGEAFAGAAPVLPPHEQALLWIDNVVKHAATDPSALSALEKVMGIPTTAPTPRGATMKYDVAFSFAGEDREHAEALYEKVTAAGFKAFYDKAEQSALWGVNLPEYLHDLYCNRARFVVMFVSKHYAAKLWPTHERRAAQERAFLEPGRAYVLPIRIDDTAAPGLPSTVGYVHISDGIDGITRLLLEKLRA
jgi:hypothetical protein